MKRKTPGAVVAGAVLLAIGAVGTAQALTINLEACHILGGCGTATQFGTVTLTQSGTNVTVDVVLNVGNRFVETVAGGAAFFLFNDDIAGSTITGITSTLNGALVAITGGLTGFTNQLPILTTGTGTWSAAVECTDPSQCFGGVTPNINDLHFTVTNATIAGLSHANSLGNIFAADILCGQTGCTGLTGPVTDGDGVTSAVPAPGSLALLGLGLAGLGWSRRNK